MKTFLERFEHKAEQWLNTMDNHLQEPIARTLSGEVFTHSTALNGDEQAQVQQTAQPTVSKDSPVSEPNRHSGVCQPVLRKADA